MVRRKKDTIDLDPDDDYVYDNRHKNIHAPFKPEGVPSQETIYKNILYRVGDIVLVYTDFKDRYYVAIIQKIKVCPTEGAFLKLIWFWSTLDVFGPKTKKLFTKYELYLSTAMDWNPIGTICSLTEVVFLKKTQAEFFRWPYDEYFCRKMLVPAGPLCDHHIIFPVGEQTESTKISTKDIKTLLRLYEYIDNTNFFSGPYGSDCNFEGEPEENLEPPMATENEQTDE